MVTDVRWIRIKSFSLTYSSMAPIVISVSITDPLLVSNPHEDNKAEVVNHSKF